jgi:hypothetical protein
VRRSERFLKSGDVTSKSGGKLKVGTEVYGSEVNIFGEMIYSYVAVCRFCAVR